jgi:predicted transcriptional regulator
MKAVMLSIQPKWIELIASGKKTVEVRKTKPKIDVPFKCYIYCTKGDWLTSVNGKVQKPNNMEIDLSADSKIEELNGKVIGKFVCDKVVQFENDCYTPAFEETADLSCVGYKGLYDYLGTKEYGYGWHITDLVIYDKPKELSEFYHYCGDNPNCEGCEAHYYSNTECGKEDYCCSPMEGCKPIKRPFQSWGYVYEVDT